MEFLHQLVNTLLHLNPESVGNFAEYCGPWLYVVLFAIVFCETGLVVTPFLPGDSLLFALGAVAAGSHSVKLSAVGILLCLAANCGDLLNYTFGYRIGPKVFSKEGSWLLNKKHLLEAQRFYDKHGRKTIILARFVPIIRTFAPFVAGVGRMPFARFALFSVTGGIIWVWSFLFAGYCFGRQPAIQRNFKLVIIAIIIISVLPAVIHYLQARRQAKRAELEPTLPASGDE